MQCNALWPYTFKVYPKFQRMWQLFGALVESWKIRSSLSTEDVKTFCRQSYAQFTILLEGTWISKIDQQYLGLLFFDIYSISVQRYLHNAHGVTLRRSWRAVGCRSSGFPRPCSRQKCPTNQCQVTIVIAGISYSSKWHNSLNPAYVWHL